ncbi:MAG: hypothetical protein ACI4HO_08850 [Ruminococcus sp.]
MKVRDLTQRAKEKLPKIKIQSKPDELAGKAANVLGFVNAAIETAQHIKEIVNR